MRAICVRRVALFERSEFHAPANDTLVKKSGAREPARRQAADEIFPRKIGKKKDLCTIMCDKSSKKRKSLSALRATSPMMTMSLTLAFRSALYNFYAASEVDEASLHKA
jgi:hypothetical protein